MPGQRRSSSASLASPTKPRRYLAAKITARPGPAAVAVVRHPSAARRADKTSRNREKRKTKKAKGFRAKKDSLSSADFTFTTKARRSAGIWMFRRAAPRTHNERVKRSRWSDGVARQVRKRLLRLEKARLRTPFPVFGICVRALYCSVFPDVHGRLFGLPLHFARYSPASAVVAQKVCATRQLLSEALRRGGKSLLRAHESLPESLATPQSFNLASQSQTHSQTHSRRSVCRKTLCFCRGNVTLIGRLHFHFN